MEVSGTRFPTRLLLLLNQREENPVWCMGSQFHLPPSSPHGFNTPKGLSQNPGRDRGAAEASEVQASWFTLQEELTKGILVVGGKGRSARTQLGGCCRKGMGAGGGGCI